MFKSRHKFAIALSTIGGGQCLLEDPLVSRTNFLFLRSPWVAQRGCYVLFTEMQKVLNKLAGFDGY